MREKMKAQKTQIQTNPNLKTSQGMEVFLTPETKPIPQPKPKETKIEEVEQIQDKPKVPTKTEDKVPAKIEEIEQVEQIEQILLKNIKKELDFSTFNELIFKKKLQFRLLLIKSRIYVVVRDPNTNKSTVVAISLPKWGGSSLRYMALTCSDSWGEVVEKATTKGKVLTYRSSSSLNIDNDSDDDIFD